MQRLRKRLEGTARVLALAAVIVVVSAGSSRAQYLGYGSGWGGYGYPGFGLGGYGLGGYGLGGYGGFGYPAVGFANYGFGYPGFGYGYPGFGFGYGYPGFGFGGFSYGYGSAYSGLTPYSLYLDTPGSYNPLFGLGMTPLGVQSAIAERYVLGRGLTGPGGNVRVVNPVPGAGTYTGRTYVQPR
jgi:hypothetical protein